MRAITNILESALYVLLIPGVWISQDMAEDEKGRSVGLSDPSACRFCLVGALLRATRELHSFDSREDRDLLGTYVRGALEQHIRRVRCTSLEDFNDTYGHEAVIELLEGAIAWQNQTPKLGARTSPALLKRT